MIYAITPKGRKALRRWLDEPTQLPIVEFDAAVKVQFAELGTKAQLLATLRSVREQAERAREEHVALAADLIETGGPFPDRLHVNELVTKFMWEQTETVIRWAGWAEDQVGAWPEDISGPHGQEVGAFLRAVSGRARNRRSGTVRKNVAATGGSAAEAASSSR
jgi:hypothetical protein